MRRVWKLFLLCSICLGLVACGEKSAETPIISSDVEFGEKDYADIVPSNNQLGFDLLPIVEPDEDGNIFISPTSLFMAISMVYNGADDQTKNEIANVLHVDGMEYTELNQANASWMNILYRNTDDMELSIANSIWLNERFHFQEEFAKQNRDYFNAEIEEINVSDNKSVNRINDWVKQSTNEKIDEIVTEPLNPDLVSLLLNAIYFKGNWKYEFDPELTATSPFYMSKGTQKEVSLMVLKEKLAYQENDLFQAVSLPYGDEEMSMNIFLPEKDIGLDGLFDHLTYENWQQWYSSFQKKEGTLMFPSFQLEYEVELTDTLKQLGMESAFTKEAHFTKMIEEKVPIWISEVKQKTFIDVNEEGTEAAAVTSVEVVTESASMDQPFYMRVDRPFFFVITDDESETILFMGVIKNPVGK